MKEGKDVKKTDTKKACALTLGVSWKGILGINLPERLSIGGG